MNKYVAEKNKLADQVKEIQKIKDPKAKIDHLAQFINDHKKIPKLSHDFDFHDLAGSKWYFVEDSKYRYNVLINKEIALDELTKYLDQNKHSIFKKLSAQKWIKYVKADHCLMVNNDQIDHNEGLHMQIRKVSGNDLTTIFMNLLNGLQIDQKVKTLLDQWKDTLDRNPNKADISNIRDDLIYTKHSNYLTELIFCVRYRISGQKYKDPDLVKTTKQLTDFIDQLEDEWKRYEDRLEKGYSYKEA